MKRFRHYYTVLNRIKRSRGFGIHSPFAFNFILRVLRERTHYYAYTAIKRHRRQAYALSGSLKDRPKVISSRNAKLLFRIASYFTPQQILQLGTTYGVSTAALLEVSSTSSITVDTVDNPYNDIYGKITEQFATRIETFDSFDAAIERYNADIDTNRPFILINRFRQQDFEKVKNAVVDATNREGVVIIRGQAVDKCCQSLFAETKAQMSHGMTFSNDYTAIIVGLRHLPLQHFNLMF